MIRLSYTAARMLVGDHEAGDIVTLEFSATDVTPGREVSRDVQQALNGSKETLRHYGLRTWSVTTGPLEAAELDQVQEFLASVEGGEAFTFEPWRYESGPSLDLDFVTPRFRVAEAVSCHLSSEGFSLTRLIGIGTGGADDVYQVTFTVVEQP